MITINCQICEKEFEIRAYRLKTVPSPTCSRKCMSELFKRRFKNGEHLTLNHHTTIDSVFADRIKNIQSRCKPRGIDFSLSIEDLKYHYSSQNGLCFYTGIPLKLKTENKPGHLEFNLLSVDRSDPTKGYTKDNIVLCCNSINMLKGTASISDMEKIFDYISIAKNRSIIKFKKTRQNAVAPARAHFGDIGYDVTAAHIQDLGDKIKVYTGISIEPEIGWYIEMYPRSSIYKKNLLLSNSVGIIDNGYRGELMCIFQKLPGSLPIEIGEKIAQLIPKKYTLVNFIESTELNDTQRSDGGFGSTGK